MSKFARYATAIGAGILVSTLGDWSLLLKIVLAVVAVKIVSSILAGEIAAAFRGSKK